MGRVLRSGEREFDTVDSPTIRQTMLEALRGRLPTRYDDFWLGPFWAEGEPALRPRIRVLDIGSGAQPTLAPADRPSACHYVGLDLSGKELERAPSGSYDEALVWDVTRRLPDLEGQFDLILSFQVLEHVKPLAEAFRHMHAYLKPGGFMVHRLSGGRSLPILLNRAVPPRLAAWLEVRLRDREPESIFPAQYDRCVYSELAEMVDAFSEARIIPQFTGALYFGFLRSLQALYLGFEEWTYRTDRRDLATYYVVSARR
jgi:SAM-dependent methyltransferase